MRKTKKSVVWLVLLAFCMMMLFPVCGYAEEITLPGIENEESIGIEEEEPIDIGEVGTDEYDINNTFLVVDGEEYYPSVGIYTNFEPLDQLCPVSDVVLKFPCPVEVKDKDFAGAFETAIDMTIRIYSDENDPSLVHLVPEFTHDYDAANSGLDRLVWPAGEVIFTVNPKDFFAPLSGGWEDPDELVLFYFRLNFHSMSQEPVLCSSIPVNGSTAHVSANGIVGHKGSVYYGETQDIDMPLEFYFQQPVLLVDPAKIIVETESTAGINRGTFEGLVSPDMFGRYKLELEPVFAPGFFGPAMVDAVATITIEPGSIKTCGGEEGEGMLSEPIAITFYVNPITYGEIKDNPAPLGDKDGPDIAGKVAWQREHPDSEYLWGPVAGDGQLYVAGDGLYCYSFDGELLWTQAGCFSNPVVCDNGVLCVIYYAPEEENTSPADKKFYLRGYNADGTLRFQSYIPGWALVMYLPPGFLVLLW
jgi:hypothetical protein